MVDVRCVRNFYLLCCLSALAACSNGRGSVDSGAAAERRRAGRIYRRRHGRRAATATVSCCSSTAATTSPCSNDGIFTFTTRARRRGGVQRHGADAAVGSVANVHDRQRQRHDRRRQRHQRRGHLRDRRVRVARHGERPRRHRPGSAEQRRRRSRRSAPTASSAFPSPIASGAPYNVTVLTQPSGPSQSCTVANGSGTIGSADVTNVAVTCATGTFVDRRHGLRARGLGPGAAEQRWRRPRASTATARSSSPTLLASGATYNVTVKTHPTSPTAELRGHATAPERSATRASRTSPSPA